MCVDLELSERRLKRRKTIPKIRRSKGRLQDAMRGRQHKIEHEDRDVWPDSRPLLRERAIQHDILEESGLLTSSFPEPQAPRTDGARFSLDAYRRYRERRDLKNFLRERSEEEALAVT
jgi:hypothetical protein